MAYGKPHRFSPFVLPALCAAIMTSLVAAYAVSADLYLGALYPPDAEALLNPLSILIMALPASIFGLFAVWPLALVSAELVARLDRRAKRQGGWAIWLLTGAVLGGPALFVYSFPLGFGQAMLGPLFLNGALCGLLCAALVRIFSGPQIDDTASPLNDEGAHDRV